MDIKKLKEKRNNLEHDIQVAVSRLVEDFRADTGVDISYISIMMQPVNQVGLEMFWVVDKVTVGLQI